MRDWIVIFSTVAFLIDVSLMMYWANADPKEQRVWDRGICPTTTRVGIAFMFMFVFGVGALCSFS